MPISEPAVPPRQKLADHRRGARKFADARPALRRRPRRVVLGVGLRRALPALSLLDADARPRRRPAVVPARPDAQADVAPAPLARCRRIRERANTREAASALRLRLADRRAS